MTGWYSLTVPIVLFLHGFLMASEDVRPSMWKWWIWIFVPILSYIAGKSGVQ